MRPARRFQFLIGRLVTVLQGLGCYLGVTFQFLIGRLVTRMAGRKGEKEKLFQFLIGRLVTWSQGLSAWICSCFNSS